MNKKEMPLDQRKVSTVGFPNLTLLSKTQQKAFYKELLRIVVEESCPDKVKMKKKN